MHEYESVENCGVISKEHVADHEQWQIIANSKGFNIDPKGGGILERACNCDTR